MNKTKLIIMLCLIAVIAAAILIPMATSKKENEEICLDDCCVLTEEATLCDCTTCEGDGICEEMYVLCPDCNGVIDDCCDDCEPCETCDNAGYVVVFGPFLCEDCDVAECYVG